MKQVLMSCFLFCIFLWGSLLLVGNWLAAGPHPRGGSAIFWAIAKLLQQGQLCCDVCSCGVCECMCLCMREPVCVCWVLEGCMHCSREKHTSEYPRFPFAPSQRNLPSCVRRKLCIIQSLRDFFLRNHISWHLRYAEVINAVKRNKKNTKAATVSLSAVLCDWKPVYLQIGLRLPACLTECYELSEIKTS